MSSRAGDEYADVAVDLQASHRSIADHTAELSMKAPLSVSKPTDLGVGGPELWILGSMVTGTKETMSVFYPGSGPLDGGKTLRPALVYIDGVSSTELIYFEIICCGLNPRGMMSNVIIYLSTSLALAYIMYRRPRITRVLVEYVGGEESLS